MTQTQSQPTTVRGIHVLVGFLVFFGAIFAVNGIFLVSALRTHTGVVSEQPYRKGLNYNQRIAADEQQRALGWKHKLAFDPAQRRLQLSVNDRNGNTVTRLLVTGFIGRPSTVDHDRPLEFVESAASGHYTASVGDLPSGNWLVELKASRTAPGGEQTNYRLRKRIWLKR